MKRNFSISPGIPVVSPFAKGVEGDFSGGPGLIEKRHGNAAFTETCSIDVSGNCPRFAAAKKSTPYYSDEQPDGYNMTIFYNDMDDDEFSDYSGVYFPDLQDANIGVANGGYYLDGHPYISYSFSRGEPSECRDSTVYFYSLSKVPDSINAPEVFRIQLNEIHTTNNCLSDTAVYTYDKYNK